ncbi:MAG: restriction endonuclease subunit S [Akkermansiaceae bacterium]
MIAAKRFSLENWKHADLGDVVEIQNGFAFKSKDYQDAGHFVMRIGNVQDGHISLDKPKFVQPTQKEARFILNQGDILVSLTGNIGRAGMVQEKHLPAVLNQRVARVTPSDSSILKRQFLFYFLSSRVFRESLSIGGHGAAQQNVSTKEMAALPFLLPPLPEQERIVAILDEAFEGIATATAHAQRNLDNARELFQSVLQSTFEQKGEDWVETTLGEVATKIGSGATPRGGQAAYKPEGISLIRSLNVYDREFRSSKLAFIDGEQAEKLKNVIVNEGDVLLNITGASVARCCVAPSAYLPARVNQHVSIIRPKPEMLDSRFLNQLLTSRVYKDMLLGIGGEGGATRQAITKAQIQSFRVALPPLNKQKSIVQKLDALSAETRRLEAVYQRKLAALAELKQSLLQRAFAGEL